VERAEHRRLHEEVDAALAVLDAYRAAQRHGRTVTEAANAAYRAVLSNFENEVLERLTLITKGELETVTPDKIVTAINTVFPNCPAAFRSQLQIVVSDAVLERMRSSPPATTTAPAPQLSAPPDNKPDILAAVRSLRERVRAYDPSAVVLGVVERPPASEGDVTALFPDTVMRNIQGVGIVVVDAILDHLAAQGVVLPDEIDTITSEMVRIAINEIGSETMAALIADTVIEILRSARRHDAERRSASR